MLIEPTELQSRRPLDILRTWAKQALRRRPPVYEQFEPVGNFIYRVSLREVERVNFRRLMQPPSGSPVRTFNAFGTRWLTKQPKSNRAARAFSYLGIGVQDLLETGRLMAPGYCALFVPVEPIEDGLKELLSGNGFRIVELPRCREWEPAIYTKTPSMMDEISCLAGIPGRPASARLPKPPRSWRTASPIRPDLIYDRDNRRRSL